MQTMRHDDKRKLEPQMKLRSMLVTFSTSRRFSRPQSWFAAEYRETANWQAYWLDAARLTSSFLRSLMLFFYGLTPTWRSLPASTLIGFLTWPRASTIARASKRNFAWARRLTYFTWIWNKRIHWNKRGFSADWQMASLTAQAFPSYTDINFDDDDDHEDWTKSKTNLDQWLSHKPQSEEPDRQNVTCSQY